MKRGEVWWVRLEEEQPVVLLSGGEEAELRAMRIVPPATADEKRGFVVLSGEEACDIRERNRIVAAASGAFSGVGVEVQIGAPEGLPSAGVVRVALPRDDRIFCTWLLALTPDCLLRRMGALSSEKLHQLDKALRLAAIE